MSKEYRCVADFFTEIEWIYEKEHKKIESMQEVLKRAENKLDAAQKKFIPASPEIEIAKAEVLLAKDRVAHAQKEAVENAKMRLNAVVSSFESYLAPFHTLDLAKVDQDTIALLDSGIYFSEQEYIDIIDKYKGNYTMLRMIDGRLRNNPEAKQSEKIARYFASVLSSTEKCMDALQHAINHCLMGLGDKDAAGKEYPVTAASQLPMAERNSKYVCRMIRIYSNCPSEAYILPEYEEEVKMEMADGEKAAETREKRKRQLWDEEYAKNPPRFTCPSV